MKNSHEKTAKSDQTCNRRKALGIIIAAPIVTMLGGCRNRGSAVLRSGNGPVAAQDSSLKQEIPAGFSNAEIAPSVEVDNLRKKTLDILAQDPLSREEIERIQPELFHVVLQADSFHKEQLKEQGDDVFLRKSTDTAWMHYLLGLTFMALGTLEEDQDEASAQEKKAFFHFSSSQNWLTGRKEGAVDFRDDLQKALNNLSEKHGSDNYLVTSYRMDNVIYNIIRTRKGEMITVHKRTVSDPVNSPLE